MTDKSLLVFEEVSSMDEFIEKHKKVICSDIFWDAWKIPEKFYFGFDTLFPWYSEVVEYLNNLFGFVNIKTVYEINSKFLTGYSGNSEEYINSKFAVFNLEFNKQFLLDTVRQYSYIIHVILRTINMSRLGHPELIRLFYENKKTPKINLLIGISNLIRNHSRCLCSRIISIKDINNLSNLEKAIKINSNIPVVKQTNFIDMMSQEKLVIPEIGDTVYVNNERHVIDTIYSLDFIKVISLEDGQMQFCKYKMLKYREEK